MKPAYYNEFDPHAAAWLRGLIAAGLIAPGWVDTRSITEVKPHELTPFAQCHFFAGIGGWSLALRLAGVPDAEPVWTGSPPCQPFSVAGKGLGFQDARDLWPVFRHLIRLCRPHRVFGEQVAAAITAGWLDRLHSDLEAEGYACGETILGAHSVGADHQRQRLYWVADSEHPERRTQHEHGEDGRDGADSGWEEAHGQPGTRGEIRGLAESEGGQYHGGLGDGNPGGLGGFANSGRVGHTPGQRELPGHGSRDSGGGVLMEGAGPGCHAVYGGEAGRLGRPARDNERRNGQPGEIGGREGEAGGSSAGGRLVLTHGDRCLPGSASPTPAGYGRAIEPASFWADSLWIECRDRKRRRIPAQPSLFPLADGVSRADMDGVRSRLSGMGLSAEDVRALLREPRSLVAMAGRFRSQCLRGAGNAIVPQAAAAFIQAFYTRKS